MKPRVRQVLDGIGGTGRRGLLKYMPKYSLPENKLGTFPSAIMSCYPDPSMKYIEVGHLTEKLMFMQNEINIDILLENIVVQDQHREKIIKSKTTQDYIKKIEKTRNLLNTYLATHNLSLANVQLDVELDGTNFTGHPDAVFGDSIVVEVKTTSKLESDHPYFIQQLSAYMTLNKNFKYGLLVLPLQCAIIIVGNWAARDNYLELFEQKALKLINSKPTISMEDIFNINQLVSYYSIGKHTSKAKTFLETVTNMHPGIPYQIFLSSNQNSALNFNESDIDAAGEWVKNNYIILYIHAPYVVNLAKIEDDDWAVNYMRKSMKIAKRLGARGVVVHVGKSVEQEYSTAYDNMTESVLNILADTDPSCPLLLETPAGQGSEMLTKKEEFVEFIEQFISGDPTKPVKIGACVDTCHVFASGYKPSEYVQYINNAGLLKLVHYNDSNDICGSCKDRHALVGKGHIGFGEMTAVADYCGINGINMVIE